MIRLNPLFEKHKLLRQARMQWERRADRWNIEMVNMVYMGDEFGGRAGLMVGRKC